MGTPFIINDKAIQTLKQFGESNFISLAELEKICAGDAICVGEREGFGLDLEFGYRLVYCVEEHPRDQKDASKGTVWLRHMSLSQAKPGKLPNPLSIGLVGELLGFPIDDDQIAYDQCRIWLEDIDEERQCVNVVCPVNQEP